MLTRDLLRFRIRDGRCEPFLPRATPALLTLADELLALLRAGLGRTQGELQDELAVCCRRARSAVQARGLAKVLFDACSCSDPASAAELRAAVCAASAAALRAGPLGDAAAHRAAVATALGRAGQGDELATALYADLPHLARLETLPDWDGAELLARTRLAICQGLLLRAHALRVVIHDRDLALRRRFLARLRFLRLLALAQERDGALALEISGPAAVLEQSTRYGLQLAQFLPLLPAARQWQLRAELRLPAGGQAVLELDPRAELPTPAEGSGWVPPELRTLAERLCARWPDWRLVEPSPLQLPGGELLLPDLAVQPPEGPPVPIELFHRWHQAPLERRLVQLAAGALPQLLLGIDRHLAKRPAITSALADLGKRIFTFSDFPSPSAIKRCIQR